MIGRAFYALACFLALFCDDDGYELMKQNTYLPTYLPSYLP